MITITVSIDTEKNVGLINYVSENADVSSFINADQVRDILTVSMDAIKHSEVF